MVDEVDSGDAKLQSLLLFIFFYWPFALWLSQMLTGGGVTDWSRLSWRQVELCDMDLSMQPRRQAVFFLVRSGLLCPWLDQDSCVPG